MSEKNSSDEMLRYLLQELERLCSEIRQHLDGREDTEVKLSEVTERAKDQHRRTVEGGALKRSEQILSEILKSR